jgi:hypothetical protein
MPSRRRSTLWLVVWSTTMAAALGLWAASRWRRVQLEWDVSRQIAWVVCENGSVVAGHVTLVNPYPIPSPSIRLWWEELEPTFSWPEEVGRNVAGFAASFKADFQRLVFPLWFPVGLLALMTWRAWRRVRKVPRPGTCAACGYDLRATPERCPKCGRAADGPVLG